jgi:threonine/homoserine/homoserine lactone efflux protein
VPGPDTFVVLRTSLAHGRIPGAWAAAGSGAGNLAWGTASLAGAVGLLAVSAPAFTAAKLLGAAYLLLLGLQALAAAARRAPFADPGRDAGGLGAVAAFRRGLLSDLGNGKVGLFWTALAPQALAGVSGPALPVAMVATMGLLAFGWLAGYAVLAARFAPALARPGAGPAVNGATGAALVLLAAGLLVA